MKIKTLQQVEEQMAFIDAQSERNRNQVGAALKHEFGEQGFESWAKWCKDDNYNRSVMKKNGSH